MDSSALPAPTFPGERRPWNWWGLLAAPFLICLAVLLVTGRSFPTFWAGDEVNHWALIQWFAKGLPRFKAVYPCTATTPLFHLACACVVRLFGPHLQWVRVCNTLLSIGGVLVLFETLRRSLDHGKATAALFCGVFLSSGYYFGYAFRLLTDNMALIACLLAVSELFRFVDPAEPRPMGRYLRGCGWCAVAVLTRQSYIFLCLPFGLLLLASPLPPKEKLAGLGTLGLAMVPFALLVYAWHGLVPPDYQGHHTPSLINLYPLALPLMILGLYTPFFFGPDLWRQWRAGAISSRRVIWPGAGAMVALAVLCFFPLFPVRGHRELTPYFPALALEDWSKHFGGWIYSGADRFTRAELFHNNLLFWLALPLGAAAAVCFVPDAWRAPDPRRRVSALFLVGVLLSSLLNSVSAQKYYDGLVLLFLLWHTRGEAARDAWRRRALYGLILIFCVYTVVFPYLSKANTFVTPPPVQMPPPP